MAAPKGFETTTQLKAALGEEKKLEEQIARKKERLERSKDLRKQLEIEEAALFFYDLLANDLQATSSRRTPSTKSSPRSPRPG